MSEQKNSPFGNIVGKLFMIAFPLTMIAMLGVVGIAFYNGRPEPKAAEKAEVATAAVKAPAAAAPTATGKSAPAAANAPAKKEGNGIDPAQMAIGKTAYAMCAACHGMDGKGLQAGPALMAPSFIGSEVLLGDPDRPLLVVLKGIQKEDMKFMGMMAPLGAALDDEKLAAVLTYMRNEWGNSAPAVTVEQAKAARAKYSDVTAPAGIKRAEIEAIVAAHKK